jgi:SAM-dependent methyltransferase
MTRQLNALDALRGLSVETTLTGAMMSEMRPRFHALRDREKPRAVSAFNLFQTPAPLARRLVSLLALKAGETVLEPSAGLGRILDELPEGVEAVAVEASRDCAAELFRADRDRCRVVEADFLTLTPETLGSFDAVAMNPPFHLRAEIRHTLHALTFLRPGGRLAGICMAGPARERELRPLCSTWETLPRGTFRAEGTDVETILFTIQK